MWIHKLYPMWQKQAQEGVPGPITSRAVIKGVNPVDPNAPPPAMRDSPPLTDAQARAAMAQRRGVARQQLQNTPDARVSGLMQGVVSGASQAAQPLIQRLLGR